jgi:hypothetical protein
MALPSLKPVKGSPAIHSPHVQARCLPAKKPPAKMENESDRPSCFSSTLQECAFVLTATLATAQTSLFGGIVVCITSHIAEDLDMNIAEVTWLSAAQAYISLSSNFSVTPHFKASVLL